MRPAVCVAEHAGEMLDVVGVVVRSVVGGIGGVLWYPVRGLMGLGYRGHVLEVCVVAAEFRDLGGLVGVLCAGVLPGCRPYHFRIGACGTLVSRCGVGRRGEGCVGLFQSSSAWVPRLVAVAL